MEINFDKVTERVNTNSYKWDRFTTDVLPMWIADMDFESPIAIKNALLDLANKSIYGYSKAPEELTEVIIQRLQNRHHWKVEKDWIVYLPGLVPGLHASARLTEGNAKIMTASPVYYHLTMAGKNIGMPVSEIPFILKNDTWVMDFETMEKTITPEHKYYFLCNPHNPNGRVFNTEELSALSTFCIKHGLILVSDEIHCDLILDENAQHISIASTNKHIENQSITLLAPSKTFNIAGLGGSFAVIPNKELREKFIKVCFGIMPHISAFAFQTMLAAYKYGEPWRQELITYLKGNHDFLLAEVNKINGLEMLPLEATYLAWIKVNKENIDPEAHLLKHGLAVSGAQQFGGEGYFRLNFGTQKANLVKAIEILKKAFNS